MNAEQKMKCRNCNAEIDQGLEAILVQDGIGGVRGFVPLGEALFFCKRDCVREYFDDDKRKIYTLSRRIP